jgi:hypothetical protein
MGRDAMANIASEEVFALVSMASRMIVLTAQSVN